MHIPKANPLTVRSSTVVHVKKATAIMTAVGKARSLGDRLGHFLPEGPVDRIQWSTP